MKRKVTNLDQQSNQQPNQQVLYELSMHRRKIELEIAAVEQQLDSVEKRMTGLRHDLFVYLGFLSVPAILAGIISILSSVLYTPVIFLFFDIVNFVVLCVYVIIFPASVYNFVKTILLLCMNRESDEPVSLPPIESAFKGRQVEEESYRIERDKLQLVLSRYYTYKDKLDQLYQKVSTTSENMNMVWLKKELKKYPIYVDIVPASPFTGTMGEQVKRKTRMIVLAIVLAVAISVLIAVYG